MKKHIYTILLISHILSLTAAQGAIHTNSTEWVAFGTEVRSNLPSYSVIAAKESIAYHLRGSFTGMQYRCASLVLDDQSWVRFQDNLKLRFSGRLNYNQGVLSEGQFETKRPFKNIRGSPVILSFPTPRGGIQEGELSGVLYVEDYDGGKRKFAVGTNQVMQIRFGPASGGHQQRIAP